MFCPRRRHIDQPIFCNACMTQYSIALAFVEAAQNLIERSALDAALVKLELAQMVADDLAGTERSAVCAQIATAQSTLAAAHAKAHQPMFLRKLNNLVDDAENALGNGVTWPSVERQLAAMLLDQAVVAALPEEVRMATSKFAIYKKLHDRKVGAANEEPLNATEQEGASAAMREEVAAVAARLTRYATLYADEFDGWQAEPDGPTWHAYTRESNARMSAFFAPRTRAFRERAEEFLLRLDDDVEYQQVAQAAAIKSIIDDLREQLQQADASLLQRAELLLGAAENDAPTDTYLLQRLQGDLRAAVREQSSEAVAMTARMAALIDAMDTACNGRDEDRSALIQTLRAQADAVWPELYAGMTFDTAINLGQPGQQIGFLADNLMGYRFKPGDWYFATTISGYPIAASIDPAIKAAIDATEQAIGRALGDDDDDGKWDIIAVVTDRTARLFAKGTTHISGQIDHVDVKLSAEYATAVDATVIEIIAAKCGPFAAAKDRGALRPDGSVDRW
jgi:hypothetical protein